VSEYACPDCGAQLEDIRPHGSAHPPWYLIGDCETCDEPHILGEIVGFLVPAVPVQ
jgi:hypothetical protein